jgi:formylglycine-generating enzyme
MKMRLWLILGVIGLYATSSSAQTPVITSFSDNGRLSWTSSVNSNAIYRIEWASSLTGPWHKFTYQPMNTIDAHTSTSFQVDVPMFYRVVMFTNTPPTGMVWIDAGDIELGQTGIATPVHTNFISGFYLDETEVTKGKWDEVYAWAITNGYAFDNVGSGKTNNHPVHTVNWYDCVKWCNARSQMENLTPCYYTDATKTTIYKTAQLDLPTNAVNWSANGYRLPTEAEWEKASRGARQRKLFPWGGNTIQHSQANYWSSTNFAYDVSPTREYHPDYQTGDTPYTSAVGSFAANGYGLHDMAGNVWEWCWDWYGDYSADYQSDPVGPGTGQYGVYRIFRGGCWGTYTAWTRCADRGYGTAFYQPFHAGNILGFRCAKRP